MDLIATLPLYPKYRLDVASHPLVSALRFNTITPRDTSVQDTVDGLLGACGSKPLWLDLKTRQLRITEFAYLPEGENIQCMQSFLNEGADTADHFQIIFFCFLRFSKTIVIQ